MPGTFTYTESTNTVVVTGGTSGSPSTFADFVAADRTVATSACSIASGCQLKAAAAIAAATDLTLTYPVRPVEFKGLRLAITTAANGGAAASGDETVDIYGTTPIWCYMTGASASGQKVVPVANLTHLFQVGDTVILIDISAPATYETDVIASISEGVSITLTNNNTNSYAALDVVGIYQTEQIDTSAAHGTFWTTLPYGQVAKLTFTGYDGTNTGKVDQPIWGVIWNNGNGQYQCNCIFQVGDASTSTYFTQIADDAVYFSTGCTPTVLASATYQMGAASGSYSGNGAFLKFSSQYTTYRFTNGGSFIAYGSMIHAYTNAVQFGNTGQTYTFALYDSIWIGNGTGGTSGILQASTNCTLIMRNVYIFSVRYLFMQCTPNTMDDVWIHSSAGGVYAYGADATCINTLCTTYTNDFQAGGAGGNVDLYVINPKVAIAAPQITNAETNIVWEQFYVNIQVTDKDGVNLAGVTVNLYGSVTTDYDTAVWTEGTVTTAVDGTITQQTVTTRKWTGTSETLINYNVFKMVISKAGYETLSKENLTIAEPIDWHLELQNPAVDHGAILLDLKSKRLVKVLSDKIAMGL